MRRATRLLQAVDWLLVRPSLRLTIRLLGPDPWERIEYQAPSTWFGRGVAADFRRYFEEPSTVTVRSLEDVCGWLLECEYVRDQDQFGVADYWQPPAEFEARRAGDCDDHALWAWRKLAELGYTVELVSGRALNGTGVFGDHAWVQFTEAGQHFMLESIAESRDRMVRPLLAARRAYMPHVAVDAAFHRTTFFGFLMHHAEQRGPAWRRV